MMIPGIRSLYSARPRLLFGLRELRDPAFRPDGPALSCRSKTHRVVLLAVERFPRRPIVRGKVGTRRAYRDPAIFRAGHGRAEREWLLDEFPGLTAVARGGPGGRCVVGLAIIAADNHPMIPVAEGDRKHP